MVGGFISCVLLAVNPATLCREDQQRQDCVEDRSICAAGVIDSISRLPPCSVLAPGLLLAVCWSALGALVHKGVFGYQLPGESFKPCCVAVFTAQVAQKRSSDDWAGPGWVVWGQGLPGPL